ncbi:hypothetical protein VL23_08780 [Stenotrophomonas maltophilia]|uniref:IS110 family transposase n=1 Tax=Stenotrophomonas maltophilia TaxID=40324 RepID=A0AB34TJM1_STEMA|nr:hypothetical protein VL23_08780 [Stenotrophomonas maltophilia]
MDVAVHEQASRQFKNNKRGWSSLIKWLQQWPAKQVVLEASGGYEQKALDALHEAGLQKQGAPLLRPNASGNDYAFPRSRTPPPDGRQ